MARVWFGSKEAHRAAALKGWITRRKKGTTVKSKKSVPWYGSEAKMQKALKDREAEKIQDKIKQLEQTIANHEWYMSKGLAEYPMSKKARADYIASHNKGIEEAKKQLEALKRG